MVATMVTPILKKISYPGREVKPENENYSLPPEKTRVCPKHKIWMAQSTTETSSNNRLIVKLPKPTLYHRGYSPSGAYARKTLAKPSRFARPRQPFVQAEKIQQRRNAIKQTPNTFGHVQNKCPAISKFHFYIHV